MLLLRAVGLWLVVAARARAAAVCDITGAPAPDVLTLTVAASTPVLYLVYPDCSSGAVGLRGGYAQVRDSGLQRVATMSPNYVDISLTAELSRGGDFTGGQPFLVNVELINLASSAEDLAFPDSLQTLQFVTTSMSSFDALKIPSAVTSLTIRDNPVTSLKNLKLPASITTLDLSYNKLAQIDFVLPSGLQHLDLSHNPVAKLERLVFPNSLVYLNFNACPITSVRGVKWPRSPTVDLSMVQLTTFEIRRSDLATLRQARLTAQINQPHCADGTAELVPLAQGNVCVISDERFNELYFGGPATSPGGATPTPGAGGSTLSPSPGEASSTGGAKPSSSSLGTNRTTGPDGSGSLGGSSRVDHATSGSTPGSSGVLGGGTTNGVTDSSQASSDGENGTSPGASNSSSSTSKRGAGSKVGATTTVTTESSSSISTVVIVVAVLVTVFAIFVGGFVYRCFLANKSLKSEERTTTSGTYTSADSPKSSNPRRANVDHGLSNDVRNDMSLDPYRIDFGAIVLETIIARGGFGVIYQATFAGQRVAVKQMLPDTWRNNTRVASFMDEIRLCVTMDHPKIVQCIGIGWTSLRDVSVVIEYMDGGDLHSVLHTQSGVAQSGREWSEPWTAAHIKSKTSIAADVADALVYLQSFDSPIIHRDLKAKNILLDRQGNAKLSDFGISREVPLDETMTREIGTVAWIAPEVLRGDRYSEKADMYSLGVLLVELDRCCHPYAHEVGGATTSAGSIHDVVLKNTQIAILVSSGKLRPAPSASCPESVQDLVARCLSFDAAERPNAMEVHHELRLFQQSRADRPQSEKPPTQTK